MHLLKHPGRIVPFILLALVCFCESGDRKPPGDITDLTFFWDAEALSKQNSEVFIKNQTWPPDTRSLAFTATGDNDDEGEASLYDLRYFTEEQLKNKSFEDDWDDANEFRNEEFPSPAGDVDVLSLTRMDLSENYYFAVKVKDEVGQNSDLSNICGPVRVPLIAIPLLSSSGAELDYPAALASLGDFNADEFPDLAVGDTVAGKVMVYYGMDQEEFLYTKKVEGAEVSRARESWLPGLVIEGDTIEAFGSALAGAGLVNGDQIPDIIVGAPSADSQAGRVYLFYGKEDIASALNSNDADSMLSGDTPGDRFGSILAACNDLDEDGYDDFAVASPGAEKVYVFLGGSLPGLADADSAAALIISGEATTGHEFGSSLACGFDLNGDGIPDLVIAAEAADSRGAVYIFYGGDAGIVNFTTELANGGTQKILALDSNTADITIRGTRDNARFGRVVKGVGNLRGRGEDDTATDLAISAEDGDTGEVFIFYGGDEGNLIFPEEIETPIQTDDQSRDLILSGQADQGFGSVLAGARDLNQDGYDDLVAGLPAAAQVIIYFWDPYKGDQVLTHTISDSNPLSLFGQTLELVRDSNGDGYPDLIIAAPGEGRVYFEF
jgi:hypothetical protein